MSCERAGITWQMAMETIAVGDGNEHNCCWVWFMPLLSVSVHVSKADAVAKEFEQPLRVVHECQAITPICEAPQHRSRSVIELEEFVASLFDLQPAATRTSY